MGNLVMVQPMPMLIPSMIGVDMMVALLLLIFRTARIPHPAVMKVQPM
jgi:hypothetical protein